MPAIISWPLARALLVGLLCASSAAAQAADVLITAHVEGDNIIDTTPRATFCSGVSICANYKTLDIPFTFTKAIDLSSTDDRDKVYIRLPSRQSFTLRNQSTQETASMQLSYRFLSQRVTWQTQDVVGLTVTGGCNREGPNSGAPGQTKFFWSSFSPDAQRPCVASRAPQNQDVQQSVFKEFGVSYTAFFPAAASLSPGLWSGFIDYPVGQPSGFDFGNLLQTSADTIRVRVEITVKHDMRVDFPASGSELMLLPPGGWKAYETSNQVPERLFHDSPLTIWAASPFAVYVTCEHGNSNQHCSMRHPTLPNLAPVFTTLTLPGTFNHNGQPVNRLALDVGVANAKTITPAGTVSSQPGMVHFDVKQNDVRPMMAYRGTRYSGDITLMFDANL